MSLTPGKLILSCHCAFLQLRLDKSSAQPICIFGVVLHTTKTTVSLLIEQCFD